MPADLQKTLDTARDRGETCQALLVGVSDTPPSRNVSPPKKVACGDGRCVTTLKKAAKIEDCAKYEPIRISLSCVYFDSLMVFGTKKESGPFRSMRAIYTQSFRAVSFFFF